MAVDRQATFCEALEEEVATGLENGDQECGVEREREREREKKQISFLSCGNLGQI